MTNLEITLFCVCSGLLGGWITTALHVKQWEEDIKELTRGLTISSQICASAIEVIRENIEGNEEAAKQLETLEKATEHFALQAARVLREHQELEREITERGGLL